jgi:hypothetical protein
LPLPAPGVPLTDLLPSGVLVAILPVSGVPAGGVVGDPVVGALPVPA